MSSLPFYMHLPPVVDSADLLREELERSVIRRSFTPFLGAGASSLRSAVVSGQPWGRVSERISQLLSQLEEEDRRYLSSVADANRLGSPAAAEGVQFHPLNRLDGALFELQLALVRLGSRSINIFGRKMTCTRKSVHDPLAYWVPLSDQKAREALLDLALDAADAARKTADASYEPRESGIEAHAIYQRLLVLCCQLCGYSNDECASQRDRCGIHRDTIERLGLLGVTRHARKDLRLDEVAWLDDLVWYTLRCRTAAYPTSAELAFQLGLMTNTIRGLRRGSLAPAAELHADYERQAESIRAWCQLCEAGQPPLKLHLGLAAALQLQFEHRRKKAHGSFSMAFTTNYDRELERAFDHLELTYHVVFPVYVSLPRRSLPAGEAWLFTTVAPRSGHRPSDLRDCTSWEAPDLAPEQIDGPIVVKLHGSPLDRLPCPAAVGAPPSYLIHHLIVLSESSYLGAIKRALPPWMHAELKDPYRELWFLGHSLVDWDVRLWLHERQIGGVGGAGTARMNAVAVDRSFDPHTMAILGPLGVLFFICDLEEFSPE